MKTVPKILLTLIKKYEGLSLYPYACPAGKLTIGYGHVIRDQDTFFKVNGGFLNHLFKRLKPLFDQYWQLNRFLKRVFEKPIPPKQAEEILIADIQRFYNSIKPFIKVKLNENQLIGIISFAFNVGVYAFKRSTLLRFLNSGETAKAAKEFDRWVYAKGQKLSGLVKRRQEEKEIFLGPNT